MANERFFEESREQSRVKAAIVADYFVRWAKFTRSAAKKAENPVRYVDLFAGPGRHVDGTLATPILILERAIEDRDLSQRLVAVFNDADRSGENALERAIRRIPGIDQLRHAPTVRFGITSDQVIAEFEHSRHIPSLFFIDPWGYKSLSLGLVDSVLRDSTCDCLFYLNYDLINAGLQNPAVEAYVDGLFGEVRAARLREQVGGLAPAEREHCILDALDEALRALGGRFILPFRFRNAAGTRTSHYLIFVGKHFRGYTVMKDVMARQSSSVVGGVASFEYNVPTALQPILENFPLGPISDLKDTLLQRFSGQQATMAEIYERHSVGTPYRARNYKEALLQLEAEGRIVTTPAHRRKNTFADRVTVRFP